jgi:hypothetical protein
MENQKDILTPDEVSELMPSSVPKSWIYSHWEELGGVKIGKRKLILREMLYANLQTGRMVVCPSNSEKTKMDTKEITDGTLKMENQKGSPARGIRIAEAPGKVRNHSNEFGLVDALQ